MTRSTDLTSSMNSILKEIKKIEKSPNEFNLNRLPTLKQKYEILDLIQKENNNIIFLERRGVNDDLLEHAYERLDRLEGIYHTLVTGTINFSFRESSRKKKSTERKKKSGNRKRRSPKKKSPVRRKKSCKKM